MGDNIQDLFKEKRWTELLFTLPLGEFSFKFDDAKTMHAFCVTGYNVNRAAKSKNVFPFVNYKGILILTIKVYPRVDYDLIKLAKHSNFSVMDNLMKLCQTDYAKEVIEGIAKDRYHYEQEK